jgi:hypothetical protein
MSPQLDRRIGAAITFLLIAGVIATGCDVARHPTASSAPTGAELSDFAVDTAFCVQEINRLRATIGEPPLAATDRLQQFATEAARVDTEEGVPHTHFRRTNGGDGTAVAENTIPWWNVSRHGSVRNVMRAGLEQMWAQGPAGAHFENLRGRYTEVGCGVFLANGEVTVSQDFR